MTGGALQERVAQRLSVAGCVAPDEEADELVAMAPNAAVLEHWVARRETGEPIAWITGGMTFCGRRLSIGTGVYVPRTQSEGLAVRAADLLPARGRAVDVCTGAGAIAAHLATTAPLATVVGTDCSWTAVACARRNGVRAVVADLDRGLRSGAFDVVTAVAPYVPTGELRFLPADVVRFEPLGALDGGTDGLDVLRRVVSGAARLLRPGGWLLGEIGGDQADAVARLVGAAGFDEPACWCDDEGDLRGFAARLGSVRRGTRP